MKIKPVKSRSLSIRKGARYENISFSVDGEKIPLLAEKPVRSLGRLYTADLSDKHMASSVMTQLSKRSGKDRPKPPPREIQGLVLPIHLVPAPDVAVEAV